jgi:hypothetical protein
MQNTARTYLYNPSLWIMVVLLLSMVEYTTRCGDSYGDPVGADPYSRTSSVRFSIVITRDPSGRPSGRFIPMYVIG